MNLADPGGHAWVSGTVAKVAAAAKKTTSKPGAVKSGAANVLRNSALDAAGLTRGIGSTVMEITQRVIKEQEEIRKQEELRKEQEARAESKYELWHMEDNIKEENKTVKVNDWLSLHTALSADNGRKVEIPNLKNEYVSELENGKTWNISPEWAWYSFGGVPGISELKKNAAEFGLSVNEGKHGEYVDDAERQWIYVGPRVLDSAYPDTGTLNNTEFEFGTKIDIKLKNKRTGEESYLYAVVGGIRGHTYGDVGQGIVHSGIPYPNSSNANQGNAEANYSTIEFMRKEERTGLIDYTIVELYVYDE